MLWTSLSLMYICQSKKSTAIYLKKIIGPLNILHHTAQQSINIHKGMINDQLYKLSLFHPALCSDIKLFYISYFGLQEAPGIRYHEKRVRLHSSGGLFVGLKVLQHL